MYRTLCLLMLAPYLSGCAALFVPATDDPDKKLSQAYQLLSVYRPKPARRLIDESIDIYKQQGNTERLAYAYLVSTDYYRYIASDEYQRYTGDPVAFVKPIPKQSIYGVRTERVWAAHELAEKTYRQVIADAVAANDNLKAFYNYDWLVVLYGRNAQKREACDALDQQLKQYKLAKAAKPDLEVFVDKSKYSSVADVIEHAKKDHECNEP